MELISQSTNLLHHDKPLTPVPRDAGLAIEGARDLAAYCRSCVGIIPQVYSSQDGVTKIIRPPE